VTDWFRVPVVDESTRTEFEARLKRARPASRAQYLKLQAFHLAEIGHHEEALRMLGRALASDPGVFESNIHERRATSLSALGRDHEALEALRESLSARRNSNQILGPAPVSFAMLVAQGGFEECYSEALQVLDEFWEVSPIFPLTEFRQFAARAMLRHELGQAGARRDAERALLAAEKTKSGAQKHPTLGLVGGESASLIIKMQTIASG
jgi:tetratricopeptide (TPR) repeat protein